MIRFDNEINCEWCGSRPTRYFLALRRWICEKCNNDLNRFIGGGLNDEFEGEKLTKEIEKIFCIGGE